MSPAMTAESTKPPLESETEARSTLIDEKESARRFWRGKMRRSGALCAAVATAALCAPGIAFLGLRTAPEKGKFQAPVLGSLDSVFGGLRHSSNIATTPARHRALGRAGGDGGEKENDLGPPARIAYFIMISSVSDIKQLQQLMPLLYSADNWFMFHIDAKARPETRERLHVLIADVVATHAMARGDHTSGAAAAAAASGEGAVDNVMVLEEVASVPITWGGYSIVLAAVHGMGRALAWSDSWDYWVNLSPSHLPLLTQREMADVLRWPRSVNASFVEGMPIRRAGSGAGKDSIGAAVAGGGNALPYRPLTYHEDARLFARETTLRPQIALAARGIKPLRPLPTYFDVWYGGFWQVLHRSFADYVHRSPDNVARLLLNYFSSFKIADESYFQTTACHPARPAAPPIFNASLHYVTPFGVMAGAATAARIAEAQRAAAKGTAAASAGNGDESGGGRGRGGGIGRHRRRLALLRRRSDDAAPDVGTDGGGTDGTGGRGSGTDRGSGFGRFIPGGPHPARMDPGWAAEALESGNLFARKFDVDSAASRAAAAVIIRALADNHDDDDGANGALRSDGSGVSSGGGGGTTGGGGVGRRLDGNGSSAGAERVARALAHMRAATQLCSQHHMRAVPKAHPRPEAFARSSAYAA